MVRPCMQCKQEPSIALYMPVVREHCGESIVEFVVNYQMMNGSSKIRSEEYGVV